MPRSGLRPQLVAPLTAATPVAKHGEMTFTTQWTPERAESWWREHLPDLARPSSGGDSSTELTGTELTIMPVE